MYIKTKIPTLNQNYMTQETKKQQEEEPQTAAIRDMYN